eukprot:SAG31_NODE_9144_length_1327_cov_1.311075_2_plen_289_part_01
MARASRPQEKWPKLVEGVQLVFAAFASQESLEHAEIAEEDKKKKEKSSKSKKKGAASPRAKELADQSATQRAHGSDTPRSSEEAASAATTASNEYFAKFLTSTRLMSLQLRDPHFRRHILVQFLIYFKHLLHPPPGPGKRIPGKPAAKQLSAKQKEIIDGLCKKAEQLLEKIAPKGHRFLRSTRHVLHREANWTAWKDVPDAFAERCPTLGVRIFLKTKDDAKPLTAADTKTYIDVEGAESIADLKTKIENKLNIPAAEQKLELLESIRGGKQAKTRKLATLAAESKIC